MEKKRKRASFSVTMPSEVVSSDKQEKELEEKPSLRQVVEVVIEDRSTKQTQTNAPQINIVVPSASSPDVVSTPAETHDAIESVRIKEPDTILSSDDSEEDDEIEAIADYSSSVSAKELPHYEKAKHVVEEEVEQEEEIAPEPIVEEGVQWKKPTTTERENEERDVREKELLREQRQAEDVKQKETVEELFGKNSSAAMPEITVHKNTNSRNLILWALTMIAVAVGVGGGLVLFTNRSNGTASNTANITPTQAAASPTSAPSPTPAVTAIVPADVKVQVLNGGGVVGAGSKMKALLEEKGYTVSDVGNASSYTYEETEINVKESKSGIRDTIEADLADDYTVGKVETTLPESSLYDIRITVGKE